MGRTEEEENSIRILKKCSARKKIWQAHTFTAADAQTISLATFQ